MVIKPQIVWDESAVLFFRAAIQYIKKASPQNAQKVRRDIIKSTKELAHTPFSHPMDKYKLRNNGSYRAYELHHFRIGYFIAEHEIRIVRVRHTSQEPKGH